MTKVGTGGRAGVGGKRKVWIGELVTIGVAVRPWAIMWAGGIDGEGCGAELGPGQENDKGDDGTLSRGHFGVVGRARFRRSSMGVLEQEQAKRRTRPVQFYIARITWLGHT